MWGVGGGHAGSPDSTRSEPPHRFTSTLSKGKRVIRPVAFRPVGLSDRRAASNGHMYSSTPVLPRTSSQQETRRREMVGSWYSSPGAMSSLPLSPDITKDSVDQQSPPASNNRVGKTEGWTSVSDVSIGSASISELEAALKERDSELQYLRQTMEHNEQVIFHVYQEKEKAWDREMNRLKSLHESRLRASAHKTLKLEQMLIMHTYQLQEDKKRLQEEGTRLEEENVELRRELELIRTRLEDAEWGLCQKSGELALLRSQLKDSQSEQASKCHELVGLRNQVRQLEKLVEERQTQLDDVTESLQDTENRIKTLEMTSTVSNKNSNEVSNETINSTTETDPKEQVVLLSKQLIEERTEWEKERVKWAEEKDKVLSYQRQLQLNYIQMYKRNCSLEQDLERLTLQLDTAKHKTINIVAHTV